MKKTFMCSYFTPVSIQWCLKIVQIIQLTKNGIILSWAVEGQGGRFHVNELNNTAIVQVRIRTAYWRHNWSYKNDSRFGVLSNVALE